MILIRAMLAVVLLLATMACAREYPLGLPKAKPEAVGMSSERLQAINTAFTKPVADEAIPGLITIVARQGKVVHFEKHGHADVETKTPLKPDTLFRIYSMTKPIIGVGIMMLYEQGRFELEDPVSKFIPEFASIKVYSDQGLVDLESPLTIRHLMTHTSGLVDAYMPNPVSESYKAAGLDAEWSTMVSGINLEQYVEQMTQQPLLFQPGERWYYGMNMTVLGRLIEVISKQPLGEYLQQQIFQPLRMKDTDYYAPKGKQHRLASIYKNEDGQLVNISERLGYNSKPSLELGDTGLVSTAIDYLRFTQMLLNDGELDGVRLLEPNTVKLMVSNHLPKRLGIAPLSVLEGYPVADREGMGYGITMAVVTDAVAAKSEGSTGEYTWGGAAATEFWVDPKEDMIGLVLTQLLAGWKSYPIRTVMHQSTYNSVQ